MIVQKRGRGEGKRKERKRGREDKASSDEMLTASLFSCFQSLCFLTLGYPSERRHLCRQAVEIGGGKKGEEKEGGGKRGESENPSWRANMVVLSTMDI